MKKFFWIRGILLVFVLLLVGCNATVEYGIYGGGRVPIGPNYLNGVDCDQFRYQFEREACWRAYWSEKERQYRRWKYYRKRRAYEYGRRGAELEGGPWRWNLYEYKYKIYIKP